MGDEKKPGSKIGAGAYVTQAAQTASTMRATSNSIPASAKASVGTPRIVETPSLGVSLESLDSLVEKRRALKY